jgi:hypothetical protein
LAQKDKLLEQRAQALQELQAQHEAAFGDLQKKQVQQALDIKDQHTNEMHELKERLAKAELGRNATVDDELEQLLHEFEQAEHAHHVELANLEQSHYSQLSNLRESQQAQLQGLKNSQSPKSSNWRLMPTDAISWPAPQPLSILRKTGGPRQRERKTTTDDDGLDIFPQDPKKVQVYISSVSGNVNVSYTILKTEQNGASHNDHPHHRLRRTKKKSFSFSLPMKSSTS